MKQQLQSPRLQMQVMPSSHLAGNGGANAPPSSRYSPRMSSFVAANGANSNAGGQPLLSPSAGSKRRGSTKQARQSAMSHFSQMQPGDATLQTTNEPGDVSQHQQQNEQNQRKQAKSGRIGIFGNYLASRISSFQQQKFLLNPAAGGPSSAGSRCGTRGEDERISQQPQQQVSSQNQTTAQAVAAMASNPLSGRKVSAQQTPSNEQILLQDKALMNATSNTVTNGVMMPHTVTHQQDINMPPGNNSFMFGVSNFGSVSTNDGHNNMKTNVQKSVKGKNMNLSPFQIQGKPKQIVTRGEQEAQALAEAKKIRKERRERNASQAEQAISLLPMVRRDYNAAQTYDQNYHDLEQTNNNAKQSLDNLQHARIRQAGAEQYKTAQGKAAIVDPRFICEVASTVNKSYQGNLTKLLRQVHLSDIEHRTGDNRDRASNNITNNATKPQPSFVKSGQMRGAGFYNNSMAQSRVEQSTWDMTHSSMRQQHQQYQRSIDKRQGTNVSPDIVMGSSKRGNSWMMSQSGGGGSKNNTTATQLLAMGHDSKSGNQQLRGQSQTPVDELKSEGFEGNASPKQGHSRPGGGQDLVRSYDHSVGSQKGQVAQPGSRDSRTVTVNNIYMGPELPGIHDAHNPRHQNLKTNDMPLNTSTSQVITDAQRYVSREDQQLIGAKNLPINSKLNAALRHNARPGLGPCLNNDDRQVTMIDKIWGRFNTSDTATMSSAALLQGEHSGVSSHKKLPTTRDGRDTGESKNAVSLIKSTQKGRLTNNNDTGTLLARGRPRQIDVPLCSSGDENTGRTIGFDNNTPVWLPKKDLMMQRNPNGPYATASGTGSKSQAIENIQTVVALHRATDEQFDYKDFNFIVAKQRQQQQQQQAPFSDNVTYLAASQNEKNSHSNSPIAPGTSGGRYGENPNINSENKKHAKLLAQSENNYYYNFDTKKRQSTDLIQTTVKLENAAAIQSAMGKANASIKIQIDEPKTANRKPIAANDSQLAYQNTRPSQKHLFKTTGSGLSSAEQNQQYLCLSQKKKNQKQWPLPNASSKSGMEELMPKYHVTIQIDPSVINRSPQNASSHLNNKRNISPQSIAAIQQQLAIEAAQSPHSQASNQYQFNNQPFNIVRQQAVPVKQHVIPGLSGSYQVGTSTLVDPNQQNNMGGYPDHSQQLLVQRHSVGAQMQGLNSAQVIRLNNNGVISPRSVERRNLLVFSPEPKMIELSGEEARMKTLPLMYQYPKRQQRPKGGAMSHIDERTAIEYFMTQVANKAISGAENYFSANGEHGFRMMIDPDSEEMKALEQSMGKNSSLQGRTSTKRQYLCPYASAKIQKLRDEKAKARGENGELTKKTKLKAKQTDESGAEAGSTEESKDIRTADQKAEDLKNHQRELLRKFVSKFPPKRLPNIHAELEEERNRFMQARKDANKKYTEISANNNKPGKLAPLKFVICEGNNSYVFRRVMQSRLAGNMPGQEPSSPKAINGPSSTTDTTADETEKRPTYSSMNNNGDEKQCVFTQWQETNTPHLFNFKWKPTSNGINFERLGKFGYRQLVNHIEGHGALTTKDQLFINMKAYCERKQLDVYDMIPLTFAVDFSEMNHQQRFDQILHIISLFEKHITLAPSELNYKLQSIQQNYDKSLKSPLSIGPSEHQGKNLWLLKPTGFNRGIGIHVFNSLEDLQNILWTHYRICTNIPHQYKPNNPTQSVEGDQAAREARNKEIQKLSNAIAQDEAVNDELAGMPTSAGNGAIRELKNSAFVVQKYIEAPLLFRKRKFDIRIWSLISHDMRLYVFKEAYVRTSSEEYDLSGDKLDQVYVHLTNNAVQKYSKNYGMFEEGNIVSVKALAQELSEQEQFSSSMTGEDIERSLYEQMRVQIKHTYEAVRSKLKFTKHTFELVGYDFMVVPVEEEPCMVNGVAVPQCSFKTKLIEANTNPCLEESNQLLKQIVPRMLDDMLKIVMDPLFGTTLVSQVMTANETENGLAVQLAYPVDGYSDKINMFELLTNVPNF